MRAHDFDYFCRQYAETALWSSVGEDGEPLDRGRDIESIAPAAWETMRSDCREFIVENIGLLWMYAAATKTVHVSNGNGGPATERPVGFTLTDAAHDFWLTRNGHGVGFWDRGLGDLGGALTDAAKGFGECALYVGDDGQVKVECQ